MSRYTCPEETRHHKIVKGSAPVDRPEVSKGSLPGVGATLTGPPPFGVVAAHYCPEPGQMTRWIEQDVGRSKTWGQMIIAQDQVRKSKLIVSQVRGFKKDLPISELAAPGSLVRVCEDDHDEIG